MAMSTDRPAARRWEIARKVAVTLALAACVLLSFRTTVDEVAEVEFEALFHRALVSFALARTLNGVLSAVQGTELALQPAGVGVTLTPGEILDPVNDLVERFSWIMLAATISLGMQQVLLEVGQWWVLRSIVAILAIAWLGFRLTRRRPRAGCARRFEHVLFTALVLALFLRFSVPLALVLNEWSYGQFLESRYRESVAVIESAGREIEQAATPADGQPEETDPGIGSMLRRALESARQEIDLDRRLQRIERRATELVTHLVQLSVVFVLQTGVFPIAFLWALIAIFKQVFRRSIRAAT